ncbi:hypothetical protein MHK_002068 [Candidatus Magnetomorum sp. HK-1]|nr:hypothetical protein MHK_002068 [Candidatus Magnetomorum sp. HK-1]
MTGKMSGKQLLDLIQIQRLNVTDFTLNISGTPQFKNQRWKPDSFNLTGFHVDPQAPPTFFNILKVLKALY